MRVSVCFRKREIMLSIRACCECEFASRVEMEGRNACGHLRTTASDVMRALETTQASVHIYMMRCV